MLIYITTVPDLDHDHDEHFVSNLVNNPIVTQANTIELVCPF